MIWCIKTYLIAYVKIQKKNEDILSIMSNLQPKKYLTLSSLSWFIVIIWVPYTSGIYVQVHLPTGICVLHSDTNWPDAIHHGEWTNESMNARIGYMEPTVSA